MKVRELLSSPSMWTQNAFARDKLGNTTNELDEEAVCFCLRGAINKCYPYFDDERRNERYKIIDDVSQKINCSILAWNDAPERTFTEVKAVIDELDI